MMGLASTLASTGDHFFYFFAKKCEKQQKSMKSKHKVFLMWLNLGHCTSAIARKNVGASMRVTRQLIPESAVRTILE